MLSANAARALTESKKKVSEELAERMVSRRTSVLPTHIKRLIDTAAGQEKYSALFCFETLTQKNKLSDPLGDVHPTVFDPEEVLQLLRTSGYAIDHRVACGRCSNLFTADCYRQQPYSCLRNLTLVEFSWNLPAPAAAPAVPPPAPPAPVAIGVKKEKRSSENGSEKKQKRRFEPELQCAVCMERAPTVEFCKCGHTVLCARCFEAGTKHGCPLCAADVDVAVVDGGGGENKACTTQKA